MGLPVELNTKIVEFLKSLPNIHDSNSQRALLFGAGLDSQLQDQIYFSGPPAQFFQLLIPTLLSYGKLKDGRDALEAVLESAKNSVGQEKKDYCDTLIRELRSFRSSSSQQTGSPERSILTTIAPKKATTAPQSHSAQLVQTRLEKGTTSFSWLHLTDFHCGMKNQHWLWPGAREIFFEDLKRLHEKCGSWDLVLFTGDLSQKGSAEEFQKVNEILEQLWEHFKQLGSSPELLVVPGNHDLVRPNSKDPSVRLLQQWEDQADIREEFWEEAESSYRHVVINAFENYSTWWEKQSFRVKNTNPGILPGDFSATFEKHGAKLGILGLNTSFLQLTNDNYEGKLALHTRQFHEACDDDGPAWAKQHHACLLMTHHPSVWLNPDSQKHLNGEITAHGRFAVHLCGHMHETVYCDIAESGTEARRIWQGRSLFGLEYFGKDDEVQRLHGYTAGKIELSTNNKGRLMFWPREARLQGWQRSIVPDYSLALTDDQHTHPRDFELLQLYKEVSFPSSSLPDDPNGDLNPAEGKRIVLSYKRKVQPDERLLNLIEKRLKEAGYRVFIDQLIQAKQITKEIEQADALIVLLSPASVQSEMVAFEVEIAHQAAQTHEGKPRLLPVQINFEDPLPPELSGKLESLQPVLWHSPEDDTKLIEEVLNSLTNPPQIKPSRRVSLEMVGGAVPLDSKFYVIRPEDEEFQSAISRRDPIVRIKGARQMGKTSLLARGLQRARKAGTQVVLIDFQKLNDAHLQNLESFYLALAEMLAEQLDLEVYPQDKWRSGRSPNINFERYLCREVLTEMENPLLWAMDEVDRLFSCDFGGEVFALFRSWHNERALNPCGEFSRLTLAIAYATEAHLFIRDLNQSPFNVGTRVYLIDFTFDQVTDLNRRYDSPLRGDSELKRFYKLVGGQPYLVQSGLNKIVSKGMTIDEFVTKADHDDGPFDDHLRRILLLLARDSLLCETIRGILQGKTCPDFETFYRLRSAGILSGESRDDARLRCKLYETYLKRHLG